ncbi:SLBB domain-containing protein [Hippea sp. KM1]|uniref:SLBB domain-containing protein n=1 Tax=Hippea sp. KM1 TaxID=944481 RepID=UPI00046D057A|nr:SLBB domain-containing protein [Hippea sp. KM1]
MKRSVILFGIIFIIFGFALASNSQNIQGSPNLPANISQTQLQQVIQNNPQFKDLTPEEIQRALEIVRSNRIQQKQAYKSKYRFYDNTTADNLTDNITRNKNFYSEREFDNNSGLFSIYLKTSSGVLDISLEDLKPYGYSLFERKPSEPLFVQPVPPNYVIGPGDEIQVILWGRINAQYNLKVGADGRIFFPNIGPLMVAGMTYSKMQDFLKEQAKRIIGTNVSITLNGLHQIQVFVLGEVKKPGLYSLPAMSTVLDALMACGGPTTRGTLRKIELKRYNRVVNVLDIYDVLMKGDRSHDWILRNNDVVFVPLVGPLVGIAGNVKRPGIYELKKPASLKDIVNMAGGLLPNALSQVIQVVRFKNHKWRIVKDIEFDNKKLLNSFMVKDGDLVKVFSVRSNLKNSVELIGNVKHPGVYSYHPGMKLSELIKSYNDLLPNTYLKYGLIKRYNTSETDTELLRFDLRKILNGQYDIALKPLDKVYIFPKSFFKQKPKYFIFGEVRNPGIYETWDSNFRIKDLIMKAGGLKEGAYMKRAEIVSYKYLDNGSLAEMSRKYVDLRLAMMGDPSNNILLKPFDRVFIRKMPGWGDVINVTIKGEVKFPGVYTLKKGAKLSDLIKEAGGYKDDAYLKGAEYLSPTAREIQQKALEELVRKLQSQIFLSTSETSQKSLSAEEAQTAKTQMTLAERFINTLKQLKAKGRVVIRLAPVRIMEGTPYDIELEDKATLIIPKEKDIVSVVGAVMSPSTFVYSPDFSWKDYIKMAGGYSEFADKSNVFVLKVDGSAYKVSSGAVKWNPFKSRWEVAAFSNKSELDPGDTIVVPSKVQFTPWLRNIKDITQVLMQIAVTTGVVLKLY